MKNEINAVLENMTTTTPEPEDYTGEDGLLYCGKCRKPKEAYFAPDKAAIFGRDRHPAECDCQRAAREEREAAEKRRRHLDTVEELKRRGFTDPTMRDWTFENDNGRNPQTGIARRYVEHWEDMRTDNIGCLFWGGVGTGKSYLAGCIANALMEKEIPVHMTNFALILNDLAASFENRNEYISRLCRYPLLILDDFGMERGTRKSLEARLAKLNDQSRKDDVVTFEQLGVDRLFIDESHYFKNLFLATKMRNVGGIAQTEAQKSSDLFMKCQYLDELTGGRGVIFATGTPISNSMVELYTIQRYLQYRLLQELGLIHFDDWASSFGETVTAIELSPEGTGYRAKTRFAKFYNLPELMAAFKEVADIQTADMLKLPVPKANFHTEVIQPSELQKEMIKGLAERAEKIRAGGVDPHVDNMLRITNDGRKLALDMRLINPLAADDPNGKVAVCARNVFRIWEQTKEKRSAQLVFCDLSTPTTDGSFSVYDDLKKKLMDAGIPEEEIAFIHTADSEAKKKELFSKVRAGQVRVLLGSTAKMGAGTNVQDRLIALHDLDCPWRPSDVGRILRTFKIKKNVEVTDNGKIII